MPFALDRERLGPLPIVNRFLEKLGLEALLDQFVPTTDRRCGLPYGKGRGVLLGLIIVERDPIYHQHETVHAFAPAAPGLAPEQVSHRRDDALGRALDRLFDADRGSLLTAVVVHAIRVRPGTSRDVDQDGAPGSTRANGHVSRTAVQVTRCPAGRTSPGAATRRTDPYRASSGTRVGSVHGAIRNSNPSPLVPSMSFETRICPQPSTATPQDWRASGPRVASSKSESTVRAPVAEFTRNHIPFVPACWSATRICPLDSTATPVGSPSSAPTPRDPGSSPWSPSVVVVRTRQTTTRGCPRVLRTEASPSTHRVCTVHREAPPSFFAALPAPGCAEPGPVAVPEHLCVTSPPCAARAQRVGRMNDGFASRPIRARGRR